MIMVSMTSVILISGETNFSKCTRAMVDVGGMSSRNIGNVNLIAYPKSFLNGSPLMSAVTSPYLTPNAHRGLTTLQPLVAITITLCTSFIFVLS